MREASNTPTSLTLEKSEYEKIREGNIAEREAMESALKADFADFKKDSGIAVSRKAPPKKKKRIEYDSRGDEAGFQRKSARLSGTPEDKELEVIYIKITISADFDTVEAILVQIEISHILRNHEIFEDKI